MWESPRRSSWSSSSSSSSRAGRYCETDSTLSGFSSVDEPAGEITPHSISSDSKQSDEATEDEEGGGEPEGSDSNSTNDVSSSSSNTTDLENLIQLTDDDLQEPWADFMKRATHTAEALAHKYNVEDWATLHLRRQWRWAQRVAQ